MIFKPSLSQLKKTTAILLFFFCNLQALAMNLPVYDYPLHYNQHINHYLPPKSQDYAQRILSPSYQKQQLKQFYNHYFNTAPGGLSPWSKDMIDRALPYVKETEWSELKEFDNSNKTFKRRHYAENFQKKDLIWINEMQENIGLAAMNTSRYQKKKRAIAIHNTAARRLPDAAPDFYHSSIAGQGFPFDNLQNSVIWAGTPLYVMSTTLDKAWSLVLNPEGFLSWVKSEDIAYASESFILQWQKRAKQGMVAISKSGVSILSHNAQFQFMGYIGAVFPLSLKTKRQVSILIPIKSDQGLAKVKIATLDSEDAEIMPRPLSKKNMAGILKQLHNRPYGWGGIFFNNDCSQEMKSIFTPFGIWLPRNSTGQSRLRSSVDLSSLSINARLSYLRQHGHPLLTLIYVDGHIMLYIGKYNIKKLGQHTLMTYQNLWGLSSLNNDKRYVLGRSMFFPLLEGYSELPELLPQAAKDHFKLVFLDALDQPSLDPLHVLNCSIC